MSPQRPARPGPDTQNQQCLRVSQDHTARLLPWTTIWGSSMPRGHTSHLSCPGHPGSGSGPQASAGGESALGRRWLGPQLGPWPEPRRAHLQSCLTKSPPARLPGSAQGPGKLAPTHLHLLPLGPGSSRSQAAQPIFYPLELNWFFAQCSVKECLRKWPSTTSASVISLRDLYWECQPCWQPQEHRWADPAVGLECLQGAGVSPGH